MWEDPDSPNTGHEKYQFLKNYIIQHDLPLESDIDIVLKSQKRFKEYRNIDEGTYTFSIRTVDILNRRSEPVIVTADVPGNVQEGGTTLGKNVINGGFLDGGF